MHGPCDFIMFSRESGPTNPNSVSNRHGKLRAPKGSPSNPNDSVTESELNEQMNKNHVGEDLQVIKKK